MNLLTVAGNLGRDPEIKEIKDKKFYVLNVACKVSGKKDQTIWWNIAVFDSKLHNMLSYFKKGSAIVVTGEMSSPRVYKDKQGNNKVSNSMTAHNVMFSPFMREKKEEQPSKADDFEF